MTTDLTKLTPKEVDQKIAAIYEAADPHWRTAKENRASAARYVKWGGFEESVKRHTEVAEKAAAKAREIEKGMEPFEAEFTRRGGWSRYFLCTSDGGHIHLRHCHSFRPTTRIGWLPEMSGQSESTAVETYGDKMCTHCFPTAPTHPAFTAAAKASAKAAAEKYCPGSGKDFTPGNRRCPDCGRSVTRASRYSYSIRKHPRAK
jgi:hypothetical protein